MTPEPTIPRKYPRIRAPKGTWVGWKSAAHMTTSLAETMGLGGLFLHTANPPSQGSNIELIFDLPTGQIRARAVVRSLMPGKGMGIQFVQMRPEDRAKLHRYLSGQEGSQTPSRLAPGAHSRAATRPAANSQLALSPRSAEAARFRFEREIRELVSLTGKATYYQLLGVTSESPGSEVKKSYYSLVRKFHPDNHMGKCELITSLKDLMVVISEAYKTLGSDEKRAAYDKRLAARGGFTMHREKTGIEESVEEWIKRANECLGAKNFLGSVVWLRKCVEAAPEQALYRAMLARSLGKIPQYQEEAIEHFQKAIILDPWREVVYVLFAELLEEMQHLARARDIYSKLLEFNPLHSKAHERLAALQADEKVEKSLSRVPHLFGRKS